MSVLRCPRCRRTVADTEQGRVAHGVSCVHIPEHRPEGWGVKTPKQKEPT